MLSLTVGSGVVAFFSICIAIAFLRVLMVTRWLTAKNPIDDSPRCVDVIIPARNEEQDLRHAVESIQKQRSVSIRVVIINDHSTDETASIAKSLAESDDRIGVINDPTLRDGWFGKANAMQHGLAATSQSLLIFTDADVLHHRDSFAEAILEMERREDHFLSLFPTVELESFWENVLVPHLMIAGMVAFLHRRLEDPRSPHAVAAGAFILVQRDALEAIGGLESVKNEALDDVKLAQRIKQNGYQTGFCFAPDLIRVRLFKSNRDAFWGFTKNILSPFNPVWLAIPFMFLPIFVYASPLLAIAAGLYQHETLMVAIGIFAYVTQAIVLVPATRLCRLKWYKALCFPIAALPITCCIIKAYYHHYIDRGVKWRGRVMQK
ncbi:4,4'-diaponeurosporenoate glycosyltransferase [Novipirellula aureliae]|uniref:4,4'-diaponeurosporenoate glycosyltransferase n=1 Tax=Novipirellula aureliae TaxID=2527966 RepID=A0A5C6DKB7_9BACT|nr:glycosyltransferase family 2 protein [Novipirellula aureliae]TWU35329.1 4,4'-diaponeurosporenoate glycosyltransferase [Novipirellula aureliae]